MSVFESAGYSAARWAGASERVAHVVGAFTPAAISLGSMSGVSYVNAVGRNTLQNASLSKMIQYGETSFEVLHDTSTPWYKFLSPKYEPSIVVHSTIDGIPVSLANRMKTAIHEGQHASDVRQFPGLIHLIAKDSYFPGSGFARYFFEFRGYRAEGGLRNLFTPFNSFGSNHIRYFAYDTAIFGFGGAFSTYNVFWLNRR